PRGALGGREAGAKLPPLEGQHGHRQRRGLQHLQLPAAHPRGRELHLRHRRSDHQCETGRGPEPVRRPLPDGGPGDLQPGQRQPPSAVLRERSTRPRRPARSDTGAHRGKPEPELGTATDLPARANHPLRGEVHLLMDATRTREGFIMNATRFLGAMTVLVAASGCKDAAEAPCLIQRPPLGGYTMKFTLQGAAPAGCEATLPGIFGDNWRMDMYADRAVYMKSDFMLYPEDGGDPDHPVLGQGTLPDGRVDGICPIPDVTEMRSDTDPFGNGQLTLAYHAHDMRFLSGARYQGATFEAVVDVTMGTCTAAYDVQAITPSQTGGTCVSD